MAFSDGDPFVSGSLLSFQQGNRMMQNYRGAAVPSNLQAGALWSDSGDDKLWHQGASLFEVHTGATTMYKWLKGGDKVSAAALDISAVDGNYFDVTGANAITSITTSGRIGTIICIHFDAALTFTHHATDLILPGAANITTAAGDEAIMIEYASGDWRCLCYTKASGEAIVGGAGDIIEEGDSKVEVVDAGTGYITTEADGSEVRRDAVLGNIQPLQPAFLAYAAGVNDVTGDATLYTLIFGAGERFDQGGNFDGTSTFTAPITGRYPLVVVVLLSGVEAAHTYAYLAVTTSNKTYELGFCNAAAIRTSSNTVALTCSLIVDMDINDTAIIAIKVSNGNKTVDISTETYFSGALLC